MPCVKHIAHAVMLYMFLISSYSSFVDLFVLCRHLPLSSRDSRLDIVFMALIGLLDFVTTRICLINLFCFIWPIVVFISF